MDKAQRIRDDCRVLMVGEEGPTKAGYVLEIDLLCSMQTDDSSPSSD